jgi:hypothetical protein
VKTKNSQYFFTLGEVLKWRNNHNTRPMLGSHLTWAFYSSNGLVLGQCILLFKRLWYTHRLFLWLMNKGIIVLQNHMVGPFTHMRAYLQQEVVIKKHLHLETSIMKGNFINISYKAHGNPKVSATPSPSPCPQIHFGGSNLHVK